MRILNNSLCAGLCATVLTFAPAQGFAKASLQDMGEMAHAGANVSSAKAATVPIAKAPGQRRAVSARTRRAQMARNTRVVAPGGYINMNWGRAAKPSRKTTVKPGQPDFVVHNSDGSVVDGPSDGGARAKTGKTQK